MLTKDEGNGCCHNWRFKISATAGGTGLTRVGSGGIVIAGIGGGDP